MSLKSLSSFRDLWGRGLYNDLSSKLFPWLISWQLHWVFLQFYWKPSELRKDLIPIHLLKQFFFFTIDNVFGSVFLVPRGFYTVGQCTQLRFRMGKRNALFCKVHKGPLWKRRWKESAWFCHHTLWQVNFRKYEIWKLRIKKSILLKL